jgi:predicted acyltransferase
LELPAKRLAALDAFRGLTIALMILVNTPGDGRHVYAPLQHAEWHGWTITDAVFPSFLWIVGAAIALSLGKRLAAGESKGRILAQAARRAAMLYALGVFLYLFPAFDLATARMLGVLQRIAVCYLAGAAIWLWFGPRGQVAWIVGLFAVYWGLMTYAPVPGYGPGRLDVEGNFAHWVDRLVLGRHNYAYTKTWDPEGIVSTLPAIATAIFGMLGGRIVKAAEPLRSRVVRMLAAGALLIAVGLAWDPWLPINKKLWTCSFATFMAGLDFVALSALLWIVDGMGRRRAFRPFVILGMNAIAIYVASEVVETALAVTGAKQCIHHGVFEPLASPVNASLLYAATYTLLMYLIAWAMYRKGWFLKV